ncbi:MAG: SAM-dependent methyltransferase [Cyanobacteria bacterium SBLK]|nr:SAM-dependent methyltransferase [Cyanobacteria bacterium SBLK]
MNKKEFGDFQTPELLTREIVRLLEEYQIQPDIIIEPTCGIGNFIQSAYGHWQDKGEYFGFELNQEYCQQSAQKFAGISRISIEKQNFFTFDWESFLNRFTYQKILILGNPPWVTNSTLGMLESQNLPQKSNFQGNKGLAAKTGKANFDIAEWMIIRLLELLRDRTAYLAFLCKTSTARKSLFHFWKQGLNIGDSRLYLFDAKKYFNVTVDACLFVVDLSKKVHQKSAIVYSSLDCDRKNIYEFGFQNGEAIANLKNYEKYKYLDGLSCFQWRSGLKHDAAKVMELSVTEGNLTNGFGEKVDIEKTYLYPLLKSSDISKGRTNAKKYVIVTQKILGEDTRKIALDAPRTWSYLSQYASILDNRKSSIYQKKPQFSIFGIGEYSFAHWKIAISSLYKNLHFSLVPPACVISRDLSRHLKPTMLDDTCYFISFDSQQETEYWLSYLNSEECQGFLKSLIFFDAKRVVNIDILMRINFKVF